MIDLRRSNRALLRVVPAALGFFLLALPAGALPPQPTLSLVFPAGGQRGKTLQATVYGANLAGSSAVRFSGAGVIGSVVKVENPSTVKISVAISANAELGERDVRLATPGGISSRFRFIVGDLPAGGHVVQQQFLRQIPIIGGNLPGDGRADLARLDTGRTLLSTCQPRLRARLLIAQIVIVIELQLSRGREYPIAECLLPPLEKGRQCTCPLRLLLQDD